MRTGVPLSKSRTIGRGPNFWTTASKPIDSAKVSKPGSQSCVTRFVMMSFLIRAERIFLCNSFQSATWASVRRSASGSGTPSAQKASYDSSRCAASSAWTSSFWLESSLRPERRRRTSSCQSGMGHLREPLQGAEQFCPFALERRQLLLPRWSQPVAAAPSAVCAGLPRAANPALLLQAIEHRVKRRQREAQRPVGLLLDAPRQLIAVQRAVLKNAQDR